MLVNKNTSLLSKSTEKEPFSSKSMILTLVILVLATTVGVGLIIINEYSQELPGPILQLANTQGTYQIQERIIENNTETLSLIYTNPGQFYLKQRSEIIDHLKIQAIKHSQSQLTLKIQDEEGKQFTLSDQYPFPHIKDKYEDDSEDLYTYSLYQNGTLFSLWRNDESKTLLFSIKPELTFSKLYLEVNISLNSPYVYGLGERRTETFLLKSAQYTNWNYDQGSMEIYDLHGQQYGNHPTWLYRDLTVKGQYCILHLRTSNPFVTDYNQGKYMVLKIIGGIIDFKFFIGSTAKEVIAQYHQYLNGWAIHPFWSSGYHQSNWGKYSSSQILLQVVENFTKLDLPIDIMWSDLDYMDERQDFTMNKNFKMEEMNQLLQTVKWVPLVDVGIAINTSCADLGIANNVFIRSSKKHQNGTLHDKPLGGCVWPGKVHYPDFNHPNTTEFWHQCEVQFEERFNVTPSGIWIDMNEFANFVDGEIDLDTETCDQQKTEMMRSDEVELEDLPYNPMGDKNLEQHTVSISGIHYNEDNALYLKAQGKLTELNVHSVNSFMQLIATKASQSRIHNTNLTFILTRSTMFGSGRFGSHWFGDNNSSWPWLASSVNAILNFNLFGIPMNGDDICGFNFDTNAQLCARWYQLGAFYMFMRNHDSSNARSQEPYSFSESFVVEAARNSLKLRYSLLKFFYGIFLSQYDHKLNAGIGTVVDPLSYLYDDEETLKIEYQFVIGETLIVIPVVNEQLDESKDYTDLTFYVPKGALWFDYKNGQHYDGQNYYQLQHKFSDSAFVCIKSGTVIPYSNVDGVVRIRDLPSVLKLAFALDSFVDGNIIKYFAKGKFISLENFDNVEEKCLNGNCMNEIVVTGQSNGKVIQISFAVNVGSNIDPLLINEISLYGLRKQDGTFYDLIHHSGIYFYSNQVIGTIEIDQ